MQRSSNALYLTLFATPLLLAMWLGQIIYQDTTSTELTVPVMGYDPRDILHGHYIRLTIAIPEEAHAACTLATPSQSPVWLCLDKTPFTASATRTGCTHTMRAQCSSQRIVTDITKFYIPEYVDSHRLDKALRENKGTASILLSSNGKARLKQLFIEGRPWSEWLE